VKTEYEVVDWQAGAHSSHRRRAIQRCYRDSRRLAREW